MSPSALLPALTKAQCQNWSAFARVGTIMKGRECQRKHIDIVTLTLCPIQSGIKLDGRFLFLHWKWQSETCVDGFFCLSTPLLLQHIESESESDVTWPSMVTHTRNVCSAFIPSKVHTHSSEHTHTPWTHTRSSGQPFMLWRPGSSWVFGALLKGTSVVVLKVERERWTFTPPTYNSCRTWDSNSRPLGYESDSLTSRPRLPIKHAQHKKKKEMHTNKQTTFSGFELWNSHTGF